MSNASNRALPAYDAAEHLASVLALSDSLAASYAALSANDLEGLRRCTSQQEELCLRLMAAVPVLDPRANGGRPAGAPSFPIPEQVRDAHLALSDRSRRLAALLRHCRRSVSLLSANCRFFLGESSAGPSPDRDGNGWSFEV